MLLERFHFADAASSRTPPKNIWFDPSTILAIHDHEIVLDAPDCVTKSIRVQIETEPKDGRLSDLGTFSGGVMAT